MSNVFQLKERDHSARNEVASSVNAFIARAGATKAQVAREIGIPQSTFSRRTTSEEPFDADELGALADYFDVTLVELISGDIMKITPNAKKAPKSKLGSQLVGPARIELTTSTVKTWIGDAEIIPLFGRAS